MLFLGTVALLLGPFVYELGRARPTIRQLLDGLIFITIAGIVCVYIIPGAIAAGGLLAIAFLVVGLAFPVVLESRFHDAIPKAHGFIVLLAALGMVVHAALDGIALAPGSDEGVAWAGNYLAASVILHRVPVGMAIWWSLRPSFGTPVAIAAFAVIIAATSVAYLSAGPLTALAGAPGVAWFQAFVAGSLVHIVAFGVSHGHPVEGDTRSRDWAYRVGILLGLFLIFTVPHVHPH